MNTRISHTSSFTTDGPSSPSLRRNAKDNVFCDLFSQKEYLRELYVDLHPEDAEAREEDLNIVTMERIVTSGPYNDLGFVANGRLVVLVEAQSTWSPNIATRMLLYLAETYREVLQDTPGALYGTRLVEVPEPELYVVYTGKREVPNDVSFKRDVLRSESAMFDFTVRVLTDSDGIVGQYVEFAKRFDEVASSPEDPGLKAKMLLDGCISEGILEKYLRNRYKEVGSIMFTLFSQEEATRFYEQELKERAESEGLEKGMAEGLERGMAEGLERGMAKGMAVSVRSLMASMSMPVDEAMAILCVPEEMQAEVEALVTENA